MASAPYDTVNAVLYAVRARIGDDIDTLLPVGGQVATNSQAYSQQLVNSAWRVLQQFLDSNGFVRFTIPNFIIASLPPVNSLDTAIQVTLSWDGYNDGVTDFPSVVLPQNLIRPIEMSERPSDAAPNINAFIDMDGPNQGIVRIPSIPKMDWNSLWLWNDNAIYMPGALALTDLRITYSAYLADFADTGDVTSATNFTPWFEQPVPIMRALDPLASFILAEIEKARGNMDAVAGYIASAENAAMQAIIHGTGGSI